MKTGEEEASALWHQWFWLKSSFYQQTLAPWACLTHIFTVLKSCQTPTDPFYIDLMKPKTVLFPQFYTVMIRYFFTMESFFPFIFDNFHHHFCILFFVRNSHQVECVGLLTKHESIHPHVQYPWLLQTQSGYKMALWYFAPTVWEVILDTVVNRV